MTNDIPPPDRSLKASAIVSVLGLKRPVHFAGATALASVTLASVALFLSVLAWDARGSSEGLPSVTTFGEWRQLAPESSWSIWRPACIVRSILAEPAQENGTEATLSISTLAGAGVYLVGISSSLWTDISDGEKLSVKFGFNDEPPEAGTLPVGGFVLGYTSAGETGPGFHTGVDANFLHRVARSATLEVYRNGAEPISIDLSGAAKALEILLACGKAARAGLDDPVEELYSGERPSQLPGAGNADR